MAFRRDLSSFGHVFFLGLGAIAGIVAAIGILKVAEKQRNSLLALGAYAAIYGCIAGVLIVAVSLCAFVTVPRDLLDLLTD